MSSVTQKSKESNTNDKAAINNYHNKNESEECCVQYPDEGGHEYRHKRILEKEDTKDNVRISSIIRRRKSTYELRQRFVI